MQSDFSLERQSQLTGTKKSFPLSYGQQAMWFLYQISPQSIAYNIYTTVQISSDLDLEAWHRAWLQIVERHPILRTTYTQYEDQPIQVIHPYQEIDIQVTDASTWNLDYLKKQILLETERPYNLETGPVVRVHLFTRSSEAHIQLLAMHHIAGDMWSFDILLNELQILYAIEVKKLSEADLQIIENSAIYNSQIDNIPSLPKLSYTDYINWQSEMLTSSQGEQLSAYWHKQLTGELPVLDLPIDKLRPNVQTYSGNTYIIKLDEELLQRIRKFSESEKTSLYRIFLAAFFILFYRLSGQEEILVGCPVAGRSGKKEFEEIVGYFTDPVVLRGNLAGNPTFRDFLAQIRRTVSDAKKHEDYPFALLVKQLIPERDSSRPPLFQVSLTWQEHRWYNNSQKSSLMMSPYLIEGHQRGSAFDIDLTIIQAGSEFNFCWQYNTDLFNISTVERIAGNYQTLLESILINPQQPISQLPLLTEIEQYQLLVDWNNTKKEYPLDKCIHQLFEEQVIKNPDTVAVEWEGEKLTYQQLNQQANQLANYLQKLGVNPEVLVGICVERSLLMVVGLLGILKAGGAYVPLDPAYPSERLAYMLDDSQAKVLLTQQQLVNSIPNTGLEVICLDSDWELISKQSDKNPQTQVKNHNLAYVIYTSGSTGKPKGVMIEHRSLVNFTQTVKDKYGMNNRDRVLQAASISFDAAAEEIYPCLIAGATLVLRTGEMLDSIATFIQKCWQWKLTVLMVGTAYWHQLTAELATTDQTLPPSVRLLSTGGETWLPEKLKLWQKCMAQRSSIQNLKAPPLLMNGYGPTEATVLSTVYELSEFTTEDTQIKQLIGNAFDNVQTYILDSYLQPVPIGVPGELHIGGMGLARGYLHRPDLTDAKFIVHPFKQSERIYKTGDLARYLPDGKIEFLGRIDHQVKIRGFRIELGEIETLLVTHPQISEAVVIDSDHIPGVKRLVAYVVTRTSSEIKHQLRSFLKQKLPDYMIPSAFVVLDALPLTPNGKVNRRGLPKPETTSHELKTHLALPRTESEEILAKIWCEVLHLQQVGIHDNFFELGGDSILSIQIIFKAKQAGLQLTAKQIFQNQTIAELSAMINITASVKAEQGLVTGLLPLTPIQHWFKEQNFPAPHHFNQSLLLELSGVVDWTLFPEVLRQLLLHHDVLRLRCSSDWEQINITSDDTIPFAYIDLSDIPEAEQKAAIEATANSLQTTLNIASGPIVQVAFFDRGTHKSSRLLIIIHHLAVDGVSWRILLEDLETAYQQISRGEKIQFRPKTTSFKYWSEKLNCYAQSDIAKQELTYWIGIYPTQITPIPVDHSLGANTVAFNQIISVSLSPEETRALLQEVPKVYKTQINDILLTALVQILCKWIGNNSVLLDLEGHGREEIFEDVDLSRTVGWFTTMFPVLLELKPTDNLGDRIKSIKKQLGTVRGQLGGISYGLLRYLSEDKDIISQLSTIPKAEVSFNYLGQFDWGRQENYFFKIASESMGEEHSQQENCSHLLDINGLVVDGQLKVDWTYSKNFHNQDTIENLAQDFAANLRFLISHCLSIDVSANQEIYGFSQPINNYHHQENNVPVPLHLLELSQDISELLPEDTQFAYPLAKMQEFMLHHYANDHQKMGVYHGQELLDIYDENFSISAFKKALKILVEKHPTLRTVFITQNGKPVCQVVRKNLHFSINEEDISNIKSEEQENYIDTFIKQDRQNLFNVENCNAALFKLWIFIKSENHIEFFMSMHHAITDGWSSIEFVNQLNELYFALKQGEEITVIPANNVHQEFVALEKEIISSTEASNFWKLHLQNYEYQALQQLKTSGNQVKSVEDNFDIEIILDLRECCRKLKVSPKAIFLSIYLDIISMILEEKRVCVGVIANGRTERLSDPFGALGLFWNIVPFCQTIIQDKALQIKNVQESLIDIEPFVRYPLLQILSDKKTTELFFATFNFVNFHNIKTVSKDNNLKAERRMIYDKFNFPLNYGVSMDSSSGNVSICVEYDRMYFSCQDIQLMLQNYVEILKDRVYR